LDKEKLQYLLGAEKQLERLKKDPKEGLRGGIEFALGEFLGRGVEQFEQPQGKKLIGEVKAKALDMSLEPDWCIRQEASFAELAWAICLALGVVLNSEDEKCVSRLENCVACLGWALRGAIEAQETQNEQLRLTVYSCGDVSESRKHTAFNPSMVFGRAKYPRAV